MLTEQTIDPNAKRPPFILWRPFVYAWQWLVPPTQAHRDRQSKTSRIIGISLVIVSTIAIIAGAWHYAKPIKDSYDDWHADKLVKEARLMLEGGQAMNALQNAQKAYQIAPEHIEAIRLNAEIFTAARMDQALYFIEKLEKAGAATDEDFQLKVRAFQSLNRPKEASDLLEKLINRNGTSAELSRLASNMWGTQEQNTHLLPALKQYAKDHPEDRDGLLRLAQAQYASGMPSEHGAGSSSLWEIAGGDDATALRAIEFLNQPDVLPTDEARRIIPLLSNHPKATTTHYVQALRRRVQLDPMRKTQVILEGAQHLQGVSKEDFSPFIRWLVEEREFAQVVTLLTPDTAKEYLPTLQNYLTALTMLGRFDTLAQLVNDPQVQAKLSSGTKSFYKMHLAFVTRKPIAELRKAMKDAISAAEIEGSGELLLAIGKYGEARQQTDLAEQAYRTAAQSKRSRVMLPGVDGLVRACELNGNTEGLMQAIEEALKVMPENQGYQERNIYVSLLTGREIEVSLDRTLDLLKNRADDPQRNLYAALAYYRLSDMKQAVTHIQKADFSKLAPGQMAVFAGIIRGAGYNADAQKLVRRIATDAAMLPEERTFYDKANR
ncbi:MAG: hypothetical protein KDK97_05240 [Verrucomicrobiales bacterium]|nr:hypothetical protein [Verrucomicrobiales bacterium]MCP5557263.1 hypothetical protein [Verrucomicrobiaceae bacterium]